MAPQDQSRPLDDQPAGRPFEPLLAAARTGDTGALDELFERFYPTVERMVHAKLAKDVRVGRPWLNSRFSTGDVVQDVFRSLLHKIDSFQGKTEEAFAGYLAMVVKNRLIDAVRFHQADQRDGRVTHSDEDGVRLPDSSDGPGTGLISTEEHHALLEALKTFEEREQLLIRGRLEQDIPFHELAEQLGFSSRSAAQRCFYSAQAKLALMLRKRTPRDSDRG